MDHAGRRKDFLYLALYVIFIYATLPFTPDILNGAARLLGDARYRIFITSAVALSIAAPLIIFGRSLIGRGIYAYLGVAAVVGCYAYILICKTTIAADEIHLAEYTILAYLTLRFLRGTKSKALEILLAAAIVLAVGYFDEYVQGLVPNRVSTLEDVLLNFESGLLGIALFEIIGVGRRKAIDAV